MEEGNKVMLYAVLFILGVLCGQFGLLVGIRMYLGKRGWMMTNEFINAWVSGEVEIKGEEKDEKERDNEDHA